MATEGKNPLQMADAASAKVKSTDHGWTVRGGAMETTLVGSTKRFLLLLLLLFMCSLFDDLQRGRSWVLLFL